MSIKNYLRKAGELFVEFPEQIPNSLDFAEPASPVAQHPAPKSVETIVNETPGPNLSEIKITESSIQSAMAPGGAVNFQSVYHNAGLTHVPFSAEQALEVMASLPQELPIEVKRSTVNATLSAMGKALGVSTESVVADASRKLASLDAFVDTLELQSKQYVDKLNLEILTLQTKIESLNLEITKTNSLLAQATSACEKEGDRLDDVLEFFTLDIGASKYAKP